MLLIFPNYFTTILMKTTQPKPAHFFSCESTALINRVLHLGLTAQGDTFQKLRSRLLADLNNAMLDAPEKYLLMASTRSMYSRCSSIKSNEHSSGKVIFPDKNPHFIGVRG